MNIESNVENPKYSTSITFQSLEIPVVKELISRYQAREEELLAKSPDIAFIFHYLLESSESNDKPITVYLKPEDSELFLIDFLTETVDYLDNDLSEFRKVLSDKPFYSSDQHSSEDSSANSDELDVESLDDKIAITSNLVGDLGLFIIKDGQESQSAQGF